MRYTGFRLLLPINGYSLRRKGLGLAAIVEVIVGMVFLYILLSILVTEVNSFVSRATRLRARNLRNTLNNVIEDPILQAKVYSHPLIQLVKADPVLATQRLTRDEAERIAGGKIGSVDWIEAKTFVDVVVSTVKAESDQQLFGALINIIDGMAPGPERRGLRVMVNRVVSTGDGLGDLRRSLRFVQQTQYRKALAEALNQIDEEISLLGLQPTDNLSLVAGSRPSGNLGFHNAFAMAIANGTSMEETRTNLETWFSGAMNRASASYASKMKSLSIAVAFVVAVAVNIDTLHIARTLWEDPVRRAQISSEVNYSVQSGQLQSAVNTDGQNDQGFTASQAEAEGSVEDVIGSGAELANRLQDLQDLRLPIGWTFENVRQYVPGHVARKNPNNLWNYSPDNNPDGWGSLLLGKIIGIAATVISAAQGAPFWFGIVNRILSR